MRVEHLYRMSQQFMPQHHVSLSTNTSRVYTSVITFVACMGIGLATWETTRGNPHPTFLHSHLLVAIIAIISLAKQYKILLSVEEMAYSGQPIQMEYDQNGMQVITISTHS